MKRERHLGLDTYAVVLAVGVPLGMPLTMLLAPVLSARRRPASFEALLARRLFAGPDRNQRAVRPGDSPHVAKRARPSPP